MKKIMWIMVMMLAVIPALAGLAAAGEYYQYTDENGNQVFTDDLMKVPEAKRADVQRYDEVETPAPEPYASTPDGINDVAGTVGESIHEVPETRKQDESAETEEAPAPDKAGAEETGYPQDKTASANPVSEQSLDTEKAKLDEQFEELQAEKKRLNGLPVHRMNGIQRNVYRAQLKDLNQKIDKYHKDVQKFKEKVSRYNESLKKKAEQAPEAKGGNTGT